MTPTTETRFNQIVEIIRSFENTNPDIPIDPERTLDSFGFDELDLVELVMEIEDKFELVEMLDDTKIENCKTVGDLVALVEKELAKCG